MIKGYTDSPEHLKNLGRFIGTLKNLRALDVLPYHNMGEEKYREMGLEYPLLGMPPLDKSEAEIAKQYILSGIREVRGRK